MFYDVRRIARTMNTEPYYDWHRERVMALVDREHYNRPYLGYSYAA